MSATDSNSAFMLLVFDCTLTARRDTSFTCAQYGDLLDIYIELWPLTTYTIPGLIGYGA